MWVKCTCSLQLLSFQHSFTHQFSGLSSWHSVRWSRNVSKMYSDSHHREVVSVQCSKWCLDSARNVRMSHIFVAWSLDVSGNALIFCLRGCYTAWNIKLTRGAGLGLASEHLDLLLSEDVEYMKTCNQSEEIWNWVKTDRVCEYDEIRYIYIHYILYICIWYVYVSCLGSFGWIKFNEGTLHGSKSSLPGPWPHVTALHVGSEPAAFLWDYSLGLRIFECHWTCCEIWKKVLWYILIYQSIMNSIMNFSTKDLGAKWHLIFLAQHGESQCCWPNWRMGPSPCGPLQLPS